MKRAFVRPYVLALRSYFGRAKLPLSRLVNRLRPKSALELPEFGSLEEFASWMKDHLRWRLDRLGGMLDVFPSLEYVAWQLEHKGTVEDDCDGLAFVAARGALRLADAAEDVYVVTLVLNPVSMPLNRAAHVICVFRRGGRWYVVSNGQIDARHYPSFWAAVAQNSYSQGQEIKFLEARNADLERVAPPAR